MKTVSFTALTAKTKLLTSVPAAMGLLDYKISSDGRGGDAIVRPVVLIMSAFAPPIAVAAKEEIKFFETQGRKLYPTPRHPAMHQAVPFQRASTLWVPPPLIGLPTLLAVPVQTGSTLSEHTIVVSNRQCHTGQGRLAAAEPRCQKDLSEPQPTNCMPVGNWDAGR